MLMNIIRRMGFFSLSPSLSLSLSLSLSWLDSGGSGGGAGFIASFISQTQHLFLLFIHSFIIFLLIQHPQARRCNK